MEPCGVMVFWYDGEYEGECVLAKGHEGDHYDGISWYDDDRHDTSWDHVR